MTQANPVLALHTEMVQKGGCESKQRCVQNRVAWVCVHASVHQVHKEGQALQRRANNCQGGETAIIAYNPEPECSCAAVGHSHVELGLACVGLTTPLNRTIFVWQTAPDYFATGWVNSNKRHQAIKTPPQDMKVRTYMLVHGMLSPLCSIWAWCEDAGSMVLPEMSVAVHVHEDNQSSIIS